MTRRPSILPTGDPPRNTIIVGVIAIRKVSQSGSLRSVMSAITNWAGRVPFAATNLGTKCRVGMHQVAPKQTAYTPVRFKRVPSKSAVRRTSSPVVSQLFGEPMGEPALAHRRRAGRSTLRHAPGEEHHEEERDHE